MLLRHAGIIMLSVEALDQVRQAHYDDVLPGRENARKKDVRLTNIEAAKAVADVIRTSLGPRGMDKMVRSIIGALRHAWVSKLLHALHLAPAASSCHIEDSHQNGPPRWCLAEGQRNA